MAASRWLTVALRGPLPRNRCSDYERKQKFPERTVNKSNATGAQTCKIEGNRRALQKWPRLDRLILVCALIDDPTGPGAGDMMGPGKIDDGLKPTLFPIV
jgi:hypothetical protein